MLVTQITVPLNFLSKTKHQVEPSIHWNQLKAKHHDYYYQMLIIKNK